MSSNVNLGTMRIPYKEKQDLFTEDQLVTKEPIAQFHDWFQLASHTPSIEDPNIMCLATATTEGKPSARMVHLKGYGDDGFQFCTNLDSRKGKEILSNPYGAINFFWEPLRRCVRIEGKLKKMSDDDSTKIFKSRPESAQISNSISPQGQPIPNREYLVTKENEMRERIDKEKIELDRSQNWGGFILVPDLIEFWQGQTTRLHDRIRFRRQTQCDCIDEKLLHQGENGWLYERLAS